MRFECTYAFEFGISAIDNVLGANICGCDVLIISPWVILLVVKV